MKKGEKNTILNGEIAWPARKPGSLWNNRHLRGITCREIEWSIPLATLICSQPLQRHTRQRRRRPANRNRREKQQFQLFLSFFLSFYLFSFSIFPLTFCFFYFLFFPSHRQVTRQMGTDSRAQHTRSDPPPSPSLFLCRRLLSAGTADKHEKRTSENDQMK